MAEKRGMAGWMQWTVYLGISALSGLLWFPLGQNVTGQYLSGDPYAPGNLWLWLTLTGLLTAIAYRVFTRWRNGKEPTAWWFATLFPFIAVVSCVSILITQSSAATYYLQYLILYVIFGTFVAYISLGWLIIPLAIPYVMLIGWLHRETLRFAEHATRRHVRHLVWGFLCLGLFGASEAPRVRNYVLRSAYEQATAYLGVQLPAGTELFTDWYQDGPEGNRGMWFRAKGAFAWPIVPDQQPLTDPDERETMEHRAAEVGISTDDSTRFQQGKWTRNGRTVQVTRVQTKDGEFIEVIPW